MKNTKQSSLIALLFSMALVTCQTHSDAQNLTYWNKIKRTSIGIQAGHYDLDAGLALQITTPLFLSESFALRFTGAVQWLETYRQKKLDLIPYNSVRTGLVYNFPMIDRSRIYLEGGYYMIIPNNTFSNEDLVNGGYGILGLEMFFYQHPQLVASFFAEIGITALDAKAERLIDERSYANGPLFTVGFRFHPFGSIE